MSIQKRGARTALHIADIELIGFGHGAAPVRNLRAKVGEKPKKEPPKGFFDDDDDNANGNGNFNANSNSEPSLDSPPPTEPE